MTGRDSLLGLGFANLAILRRLTLHILPNSYISFSERTLLLGLPSTIAPSVFREFVFEPCDPIFRSSEATLMYWKRWKAIDGLLEERFSGEGDFRVIIRGGNLPYDQETLQILVAGGFPPLTEKGCIHFEDDNESRC